MTTCAMRFLSALWILLLLGSCGGPSQPVIETLDDAKTARIGVMTGSTGEQIARERYPQAPIKSFDDSTDAVAAMLSGQLDAVLCGYPTAFLTARHNPGVRILPQPLRNEDTCVAVRKGNERLLAAVDAIIAELHADGTLEEMRRRWFKDDPSPYEEREIPLPTEGEPLRIGVSAFREPISFIDRDGRVTGHDGELARRIGARLNRPVEFSNMKFMALLPALQSGRVDLLITGMTGTEERRKSVDFTRPYFANAQVLLVRKPPETPATKPRPGLIASAEDVQDKRIGVLLGSTHDGYAASRFPRATILQYKSPSDIILAVTSGKVDVAIYSSDELRELIRNRNDIGIVGSPLSRTPIGMGFHHENEPLRTAFNRFLREIRENGTYEEMVGRWMHTGDTRMPDIPRALSGEPLAVGIVSDNGLPFAIVQDNRLVGFNVELTDRFGASLGRPVTYVDLEFGSIIAAVASRKIAMSATPMSITEERSKQIAFSDPYYHLEAWLFALKRNIAAQAGDSDSPAAGSPPGFLSKVTSGIHSNILHERRYLLILDGLKTTALIAVASILFGTLLGALVCGLRMSRRRLLSTPARAYIALLRGMPVLVLLMLTFYVVFASVNISPVLVSVIAFGMNFAAYAAEIYRTGIESIDRGQREAGIAMGFTRLQTFLHIVMPQTVRRILPVYKGEVISLVKMTSIVGYIAVQDLTKASDIIRSRTFDAFFPLVMVAILYFLISWLLLHSLEWIERRGNPRLKSARARRV